MDIGHQMSKARRFFDRFCFVYDKRTNKTPTWKLDSPSSKDPLSNAPSSPKVKLALTHLELDTQGQISAEPLRRSCLTGFELFCRHTCLWEAEQAGQVKIPKDVWATTTVQFHANSTAQLTPLSMTAVGFLHCHMMSCQGKFPTISPRLHVTIRYV
jgi:hypothetical protein